MTEANKRACSSDTQGLVRGNRAKVRAFARLKAELTMAFAAPDSAYGQLDADTVIKRNALKRK